MGSIRAFVEKLNSKRKLDVSNLAMPTRPSIPPLFLVGLMLWFGCAVSLMFARTCGQETLRFIAVASFALSLPLVAAALIVLKKRGMLAIVLLAIFAIGASLGFFTSLNLKTHATEFENSDISSGNVGLQEDARKGSRGWECLARLDLGQGSSRIVVLRISEEVKGKEPLRYGDCLQTRFSVKPARYETSDYYWNKGASALLEVRSIDRIELSGLRSSLLKVRNRAIDGFDGYDDEQKEVASLLAAVSCGYRADLFESDVYESVKKCGLAHLVAVSGAHLVVVSAFISSVLAALHVSRKMTFGVSAATMLSYLVLSGCPVSALRATVMGLVGSSSFLGGRKASSLNALGICAIALVMISPVTALSVSFMLSFASTAGIVLFSSYIAYAVRLLVRGMPLALAPSLALTLEYRLHASFSLVVRAASLDHAACQRGLRLFVHTCVPVCLVTRPSLFACSSCVGLCVSSCLRMRERALLGGFRDVFRTICVHTGYVRMAFGSGARIARAGYLVGRMAEDNQDQIACFACRAFSCRRDIAFLDPFQRRNANRDARCGARRRLFAAKRRIDSAHRYRQSRQAAARVFSA